MPAGQVYVFNLSYDPLDLFLNGAPAGAVPGWSGRFQLAAPLAVPRTRNASEANGRFADGMNRLELQWASVTGTAAVAIGGSGITPVDDLALFVAQDRWRLLRGNGHEIASGDVTRY